MRFAQYCRAASLVVVVALCTMTGCASYYWPFPTERSAVDVGWGDAYENSLAEMTANPEAGEVGAPIALDPSTGELIVYGYHESQKSTSTDSELGSIIRIDSGN